MERLTLATVTALPSWHPESANFSPFPVHAWVVRHRDGVLLVDTGIGTDNARINEWYRPVIIPLADALDSIGLHISDITAVVISHLHFDHCGQHAALEAPVFVQAAEYEAAQNPGYTIPEWAAIDADRLRVVRGEHQLLDGVRLLPTPGHTPGHQSVIVETAAGRVALAGQCAFRAIELHTGIPASTNLHDEGWCDIARESLACIRALAPIDVHLSHDTEVVIFH